jgi:hypothetical protein
LRWVGLEASGEQTAARKGREKETTRLATKNCSDLEQNGERKQGKGVTERSVCYRRLDLFCAVPPPPNPRSRFHPLSPHWAPKALALTPRWPGAPHYTALQKDPSWTTEINTDGRATQQSTRTPSHSPLTAETVTVLCYC